MLKPFTLPADVLNQLASPALALDPNDPQRAAEYLAVSAVERLAAELRSDDVEFLVAAVREYDQATPKLEVVQ